MGIASALPKTVYTPIVLKAAAAPAAKTTPAKTRNEWE